MKKIYTVSVGIPAHNEDKNISSLISNIQKQNGKNYLLKEIIIVSDGSSDKTEQVVKKLILTDTRIKLLNDGKRLGKTARLNQIFKTFSSDILFLIDADIKIKDNRLFSKLMEQTDFSKTPVATVSSLPLKGKSFFEESLNYSVKVQEDIRGKWRAGDNYLCFRGAFIALNKNTARKIIMPDELLNNDAFIYFFAKSSKIKTNYLSDLHVYYRTPSSMEDHLKQSNRFKLSRSEMERCFKKIDFDNEYLIPKKIYYQSLLKYLLLNPIYFMSFLTIFSLSKLKKFDIPNVKWDMAKSTK